MTNNNRRIINILLINLFFSITATAQQEYLPGELTGNRLTTDDNNQFVIGIYKLVIY